LLLRRGARPRAAGGQRVHGRAARNRARDSAVRFGGGGAGCGGGPGRPVAPRRPMVQIPEVPRGRWPDTHAQPSAREGAPAMTLATAALTATVRERALELGFDRVATGPVTPPIHGAAFARWLDAGYAGEMSYLERTRAERLDPARLLPGARSVVAVALV